MPYHVFALDMGWLAVAIGMVATVAQFLRARRLGVEGVSLATWLLFALLGVFWVSYGVAVRSWIVILGSLIVLPIQLSIVIRLKPWTAMPVVLRSLGFVGLVCVAPSLLWGWTGGIYGTTIAVTLTRGPQILELIRHEDATGVSVVSWLINVVGSVSWITFYQNLRMWAALVATAMAGLSNLTIVVLALWRHRQAAQRMIADEVFA